ncbi:hypothetical protein PIIN_07575 [Serendipita indica DSM 11827]|uniref:Cytochrome P450 n=1 Tax=Serendipita indica (strain DSM 11827) TaxID=1109443 RepID=G4TQM9_SERID|nr:hypothetical protein PIIN_07575 [Serendipita indica DSM 11827]
MASIVQSKLIFSATAAIASGLAAYWLFRTREIPTTQKKKPLPGPKRKAVIGNVLDFPTQRWYEAFTEWQSRYGDVIYVELLGMPMLVVESLDVAEELLSRRANVWSARAHSVMMNELMKFDWSLPMSQPNAEFNEQRKILRRVIGPQEVTSFDYLLEEQAAGLVESLSGHSGDPHDQIIRAVGRVIIKLAYGERVCQEHGDDLAKMNAQNSDMVVYVLTQLWFVNLFPILKHLPTWTPGALFHRVAKKGRALSEQIRFWAFGLVQENMKKGTADSSFISRHLHEPEFATEQLRDAVAMLYSAGTDTTATAVLNLVCAMQRHPDIQEKLYKELMTLTGGAKERVVKATDCEASRYLDAVWKESFRLNPPVPLGLPHVSSEEDSLGEYTIPKGTMVHANIGFMLRDKRIWGADADAFRPERWLEEEAVKLPDAGTLPYGFGKRICPGRHLAQRTGKTFFAALVLNYKITVVDGEVLPEMIEYEDMAIRRPSNFRCAFKPRH